LAVYRDITVEETAILKETTRFVDAAFIIHSGAFVSGFICRKSGFC
jgi:hypothetical protein